VIFQNHDRPSLVVTAEFDSLTSFSRTGLDSNEAELEEDCEINIADMLEALTTRTEIDAVLPLKQVFHGENFHRVSICS
jgi:hypothetical protein